ncbi:MAG: TetR/AcrR family transcriptional regulator [Aeromicrobium sp.]
MARYDLEKLLNVAAEVFTTRGYDGTSIENLAQATGLSKSSIYHHVTGKEQMLRLALERAVDPLHAVMTEPGATSGKAVDRLEYVIRSQVEVLVDRLQFVTLLLRVHGNTETERWALDRRREFDAFVVSLVREGIDQGDLRADLDAGTVARLMSGTINSLVEWYRPGRGQLGPAELADTVVATIFSGLRAA